MTGEEYRALALGFPGALEKPHFDRAAFRVDCRGGKIFTTLSGDGADANLMLDRDTQEFLMEAAPEIFSRLPNKWGDGGATRIELAAADREATLSGLLHAWRRAAPPKFRAETEAEGALNALLAGAGPR